MTKPLQANAVAGELTIALFYGIATAVAYMGVTLLTSPEARQAVADFFWQATDSVKEGLQNFANCWSNGYKVIYEWQRDQWSECAHAISEWFTPERYGNTEGIYFGKLDVTYDTIDLSQEASIHITVPTFGDNYAGIRYNLNDCDLMLYANCPSWLWNELIGWYSDDHSNTQNMGSCIRLEPYNCDLCFCIYYNYNPFVPGGVYYNNEFSDWFENFDYKYDLSFINIFNTDNTFRVLSPTYYDCHFVSRDEKCIYDIHRNSDGKYFFKGYSNNSAYKDMYFDSHFDALEWFMNQCGLSLKSSIPYVPSADVPDIQIDTDKVQQRLDEVQDMPVDSTLPMVLPGTEEQYQEMVNNPDLITDITGSGVYNGDINMPTVDGNLWKTKFPFCLPFDIINLFSGFSATAEAPKFHFLVMPANSFGLDNEEIYWDIDFTDYNYLVQILRFFIAISFVVWLIILTRKIMGS